MNQQEFQEYYKKNKTIVVGVPIILMVLLLDFFILKPSRLRKQQERMGGPVVEQTTAAAPAAVGSALQTAEKTPLKAPDPIQTPVYPVLSGDIDARFSGSQTYPYAQGRNIFTRLPARQIVEVIEFEAEKEESFERPEISYHGFFSVGEDKIAILRFADELLLTKVGSILKRGPFFLQSVLPEKIVISDVNREIKEFEVSLSDTIKD